MHSIERMGDQCVNISKVIPLTGHDAPVHDEMVDRVVLMGKQGRSMLSQAKKASRAATSSWLATWSARTI